MPRTDTFSTLHTHFLLRFRQKTHKVLCITSIRYWNSAVWLTPWSRVLESQLIKKFPSFYGTPHWSLSWARWIQSAPSHPLSLTSIQILSSHLRPGLSSGLFPSWFPNKVLLSVCATCPTHLDLVTLIMSGEAYAIFSRLTPLPASYVHIFSSSLYSQITSVCVLFLLWETKEFCH